MMNEHKPTLAGVGPRGWKGVIGRPAIAEGWAKLQLDRPSAGRRAYVVGVGLGAIGDKCPPIPTSETAPRPDNAVESADAR